MEIGDKFVWKKCQVGVGKEELMENGNDQNILHTCMELSKGKLKKI